MTPKQKKILMKVKGKLEEIAYIDKELLFDLSQYYGILNKDELKELRKNKQLADMIEDVLVLDNEIGKLPLDIDDTAEELIDDIEEMMTAEELIDDIEGRD